MLDVPRHPRYNNPENTGSIAAMGRSRLLELLNDYELWDEAIRLAEKGYIPQTKNVESQAQRLKLLTVAHFRTGKAAEAGQYLDELNALCTAHEKNNNLSRIRAEARCYQALAEGKLDAARLYLKEATQIPGSRRARLLAEIGDTEAALKQAADSAKAEWNRVEPHATYVHLLEKAGKWEEAKQEFAKLRTVAGNADLDTPLLASLHPLAALCGCSGDWRTPEKPAADTGKRPKLEKLGNFRWSPLPAPEFALKDLGGKTVRLSDFHKAGRPVLVVFYLGAGCEKCVKQLQALTPIVEMLKDKNIGFVAVGPNAPQTELTKSLPFSVLTAPNDDVFKAYTAYDDFEKMPLHGAFLIDATGRVVWQDIGFEPFENVEFLKTEALRLFTLQETSK
jgi:peroxiredoxin